MIIETGSALNLVAAALVAATGAGAFLNARRLQEWLLSDPEKASRYPLLWFLETPAFRWHVRVCGVIFVVAAITLI